jgi:2,3-dihydroxybenzoate decarboxylase
MKRREFLTGAALTVASGDLVVGAMQSVAETHSSRKISKIALEEHFMAADFIKYFADTYQNISPELAKRSLTALSDFGQQRLDVMDQNGIDYAVLSLSGPGVQIEKDRAIAVRKARKVNDLLAKEMQKRPTRYGGFAHLAMQDPKEAASELERCMTDLNFQGAMINGQTNGEYLDLDKFSAFWERAAALDAPIYLHPGNPIDHPAVYASHDELWGPVCSWNFETAAHALRLVFAGVFERYPKARLILGHMGETLPISLWRYDSRWPISHRENKTLPQAPSFYIKRNIALTTSGVCSDVALRCAIDAMGMENVLFSVDYPFEKSDVAAKFIEQAKITEVERAAVAHGNSTRLMKIPANVIQRR